MIKDEFAAKAEAIANAFPRTPLIKELPFTRAEVAAEQCRRSLRRFMMEFWKFLEKNRGFKAGMHIDAMIDHLEALARGDIKKLIINVPPGHMKSLLSCVFFPMWVWTWWPESKWIFGSYSYQFSKRDSGKCRDIVSSGKYQEMFGATTGLKPGSTSKMEFETTAGGMRFATSVGGGGTGQRADFVVIDDPHKARELTQAKLEGVADWYDKTMTTRGSDAANTRFLIVMQRLHENDLAGHLTKKESDWQELVLPARFDPKAAADRKPTSIGWTDPRTEDKEILWPAMHTQETLDALTVSLGNETAHAQLQQDPVPASGGSFKPDWWVYHRERPKDFVRIVQFWDCAQKPGISNDYSVCSTWIETRTRYYVVEVVRMKVTQPVLEATIQAQAAKWNPTAVVIEDASGGAAAIQNLKAKTRLPIIPFSPHGMSKETRALGATPMVEAGNVSLPEGEAWVADFVDEHMRFPRGTHDDQVDTTSMAVKFFQDPKNRAMAPGIRQL